MRSKRSKQQLIIKPKRKNRKFSLHLLEEKPLKQSSKTSKHQSKTSNLKNDQLSTTSTMRQVPHKAQANQSLHKLRPYKSYQIPKYRRKKTALLLSNMTLALAMKDSRKMEWETGKDSSYIRKEASTEENGRTTRCKDMAHFITQTEPLPMKDSGMMISSMESAQFTTIIQLSSKEASTIPISTCSTKSGSSTKDSWKKTRKRAKESFISQTERLTTECSRQT